jgi:hypothetical protein
MQKVVLERVRENEAVIVTSAWRWTLTGGITARIIALYEDALHTDGLRGAYLFVLGLAHGAKHAAHVPTLEQVERFPRPPRKRRTYQILPPVRSVESKRKD